MTTGRRGRSRARWWLAVGLAGVIAGGAVRLAATDEEAGTPLPVWITEYGAPTGHVRNGGEVLEVSPDEQADWPCEGIRVAAREGTSHVFAYTDSDGEATPDAGGVVDAEARFGMVGADGVPKPSAAAFRESRCR